MWHNFVLVVHPNLVKNETICCVRQGSPKLDLTQERVYGLWPHANVPWTTACTATNRAPHPAIGAVRVEPAIGFALQAFVLPET